MFTKDDSSNNVNKSNLRTCNICIDKHQCRRDFLETPNRLNFAISNIANIKFDLLLLSRKISDSNKSIIFWETTNEKDKIARRNLKFSKCEKEGYEFEMDQLRERIEYWNKKVILFEKK
jgi:hypothetical protein